MIFCMIVMPGTFAIAQSQEIADPKSAIVGLSIDQAVEMTLVQNLQGQINELSYEEQRLRRKAIRGLYYPQLSLSAGYAYMSKDIAIDLNGLKDPIKHIVGALPPNLPIPPLVQNMLGANWSYNLQDKDFGVVGASLKVPIYMGGKISAASRAADVQLSLVEQQNNTQTEELLVQLIERYYGVELARQSVLVRESVVKGMELHVKDAEYLEKHGMISKVERLYAQMKLTEAQTELQNAEAQLSTITTALKGTLNIDDQQLRNISPTSPMFIADQSQDSLEYFQNLASINNPILREIDLKHSLAKEAMKVERADILPQIAAMGAINIYDYQLTSLAPRWAVGAGLNFKIFDGLHKESNYRAARTTVRKVEAIRMNAEQQIRTLIEDLYQKMSAARNTAISYETSIEFAKEYLRSQTIAFNGGAATSVEVVDAQLQLSKVEIERLQAAYQFDVALARLLQSCGNSQLFLQYTNSFNITPITYNNSDYEK